MDPDIVNDDRSAPCAPDLVDQSVVLQKRFDLNGPRVMVQKVRGDHDAIGEPIVHPAERDVELPGPFLTLLDNKIWELCGEELLDDLSGFLFWTADV